MLLNAYLICMALAHAWGMLSDVESKNLLSVFVNSLLLSVALTLLMERL